PSPQTAITPVSVSVLLVESVSVSEPGPAVVGPVGSVAVIASVAEVMLLVVVGTLSVVGAVDELSVPAVLAESVPESVDAVAESSLLHAAANRLRHSSAADVHRLFLRRMRRWLRGHPPSSNRKAESCIRSIARIGPLTPSAGGD